MQPGRQWLTQVQFDPGSQRDTLPGLWRLWWGGGLCRALVLAAQRSQPAQHTLLERSSVALAQGRWRRRCGVAVLRCLLEPQPGGRQALLEDLRRCSLVVVAWRRRCQGRDLAG